MTRWASAARVISQRYTAVRRLSRARGSCCGTRKTVTAGTDIRPRLTGALRAKARAGGVKAPALWRRRDDAPSGAPNGPAAAPDGNGGRTRHKEPAGAQQAKSTRENDR
ncbi:hypothetical protein GCM10020221_26990 [Streptomyces thioluteus]|uniref:Uncharacterized protein n=1 Tax=Streptomyces thioluteus TaxID=66431 RepID=A0ABP6JG13_STRTU